MEPKVTALYRCVGRCKREFRGMLPADARVAIGRRVECCGTPARWVKNIEFTDGVCDFCGASYLQPKEREEPSTGLKTFVEHLRFNHNVDAKLENLCGECRGPMEELGYNLFQQAITKDHNAS